MRLRGLHWFNAPGSDAIHSSESRVQFCIRTAAGNFWLFLKHTGRTPKLWENAVATFWVLHAGRDRACLASGGEDTGTSSAGLRPSHVSVLSETTRSLIRTWEVRSGRRVR